VDIVVPGNSGSLTFECYGDGLDTNFSHQGYAILSFDITAADPRKVLAVDCDYLYMGKAMRDAIDARQKSTPTGFRNLKGRKPVEALKGSHCALQTSPANPSRMALVNITQAPGGPHIQTAD